MNGELTAIDPADDHEADEVRIDLPRGALASGNTSYIANAIGVVARPRDDWKLAVGAAIRGIVRR